jgi:Tfp pilus assembly protein PilV
VEVLVATVVLALGLLAALTAFSMASRVSGISRNDTALAFLAQEKLADIQLLAAQGLATGTSEGDFGADYPGYSWELIVSEPDDLDLVKVELIIYAPEAGKTRETRFSTVTF